MSDDHGNRPANRRRLLVLIAAILAVGAALVGIAVATGVLTLGRPADSAAQLAEERCTSDVLKRLVAPEKATISDLRTENGSLDTEGRDFSSLNAGEPLKGVDVSRITVLNVSGVANSPSEVGSTLSDQFDCRAYFVDGELVHTLVVFSHDH